MDLLKNKKIKYLVLVALIVVFSAVALVLSLNKSAQDLSHYQECLETDLVCIAEQTVIKAESVGALSGLTLLVNYMQETKMTAEGCHNTLHDVGKDFYKKFKEKSYLDNKGLCYGAYYHGIILGVVEQDDPKTDKDLIYTVEKMCSSLHERNFMVCMHGLGHVGYKYYEGDLDKAANLCEKTTKGGRVKGACVTGLFMEIASNTIDAEGNPDFLQYYDVTKCTKFTQENLPRACMIQVSTVRHTYGDGMADVCANLELAWDRKCKTSYGLAAGMDLVADWTKVGGRELTETKVGGERSDYIYKECLQDSWCSQGFYLSVGGGVLDEDEVRSYCELFTEKYGVAGQENDCIKTAKTGLVSKQKEEYSS
jgi:hypothetical protein